MTTRRLGTTAVGRIVTIDNLVSPCHGLSLETESRKIIFVEGITTCFAVRLKLKKYTKRWKTVPGKSLKFPKSLFPDFT